MKITRPARVIPWEAMTDEQRQEHLDLAHRLIESKAWSHWDDHEWNYPSALYFPHTHDKEA